MRIPSYPRSWKPSRRGFSIIELLVSIIIIGILVAVLVPVIASRTEQARIARVNQDLQNLGDALERVQVDTGYYVRLFALNDTLRGDGVAFRRDPTIAPFDQADGLTDYNVAQTYIQFPTNNSLYIDSRTSNFASGVTRADFTSRLIANESKFDGSIGWNGPYINWQKDSNLYDGDILRDGVPDDPWGNNYILFLPVKTFTTSPAGTFGGMLLEPDGVFATTAVSIRAQGGWNVGGPFSTNVFDRPTLVSLGPNGLPGNGLGGGGGANTFGGFDDYTRAFGQ